MKNNSWLILALLGVGGYFLLKNQSGQSSGSSVFDNLSSMLGQLGSSLQSGLDSLTGGTKTVVSGNNVPSNAKTVTAAVSNVIASGTPYYQLPTYANDMATLAANAPWALTTAEQSQYGDPATIAAAQAKAAAMPVYHNAADVLSYYQELLGIPIKGASNAY